jgi:hypothetical protein
MIKELKIKSEASKEINDPEIETLALALRRSDVS